ncbi:hypothetical protein Tco_0040283 [Tanacetum coccineum]
MTFKVLLHHYGRFTSPPGREFVGERVATIDPVKLDTFSTDQVKLILTNCLGCDGNSPTFLYIKKPNCSFNSGLVLLADAIQERDIILTYTQTNRYNSSFIALIPKSLDPKSVGDYRPISLIGSLHQLASEKEQLFDKLPKSIVRTHASPPFGRLYSLPTKAKAVTLELRQSQSGATAFSNEWGFCLLKRSKPSMIRDWWRISIRCYQRRFLVAGGRFWKRSVGKRMVSPSSPEQASRLDSVIGTIRSSPSSFVKRVSMIKGLNGSNVTENKRDCEQGNLMSTQSHWSCFRALQVGKPELDTIIVTTNHRVGE